MGRSRREMNRRTRGQERGDQNHVMLLNFSTPIQNPFGMML
jgi:hypothetical protein